LGRRLSGDPKEGGGPKRPRPTSIGKGLGVLYDISPLKERAGGAKGRLGQGQCGGERAGLVLHQRGTPRNLKGGNWFQQARGDAKRSPWKLGKKPHQLLSELTSKGQRGQKRGYVVVLRSQGVKKEKEKSKAVQNSKTRGSPETNFRHVKTGLPQNRQTTRGGGNVRISQPSTVPDFGTCRGGIGGNWK